MALTIYNQGFGVVREKRTVDLSGKSERAVEPQGQRHPRAHEFDHTPKDETIRLHIGDAFESRLRNHKASDRYDK